MEKGASNDLLKRLRHLVGELHQIDLGYPLDDNHVHPPMTASDSLLEQLDSSHATQPLVAFYQECDGFSLPDVRNGFFVKRLFDLANDNHEPTKIIGEVHASIVVLGSTGGGQLLALDQDDGRVFLLGPGFIEGGNWVSTSSNVMVLANAWERLVGDVEAFIKDDASHHYMA